MYCVLVYDIRMDKKGARVLNRVFKACKKYLSHIQNSVFEGEVSPAQLYELKTELNIYIRKDLDSIIIFKSRQGKWLEKELIGLKEDKTSNFL